MSSIKCACPVTDRFQCIEIRYGRTHMPDLEFGEIELSDNEPCECPCHDDYRDDIATRIGEWRLTTPPTENNLKFDAWQSGKRVCDVYWSDIQETWCIDGTYGPTEPTPLAIYPPIVAWRLLPPPPEITDEQ